jgi:hypothetical protein
MERRKWKWTAIALGAAGTIILGLAMPSAQLCAAEPQSFAEDILRLLLYKSGDLIGSEALDVFIWY